MSPEYRVEIVVPYTYVVDAAAEDEAENKAWELFKDDLDDYGHPAVVESVEEIKAADSASLETGIGSRNAQIERLVDQASEHLDEIPLTAAFNRLTAQGRMPKILVQVDDETGYIEAARLRVGNVEYFFHKTTDNEGKRVEVIRHQGETPEGHKVSAWELPFDGWGMGLELDH